MDDLGLDELRIPQVEVKAVRYRQPGSRQSHINGEFLRGPIPLSWLTLACEIGGKVLATALAIWFLAGLKNTGENLLLTSAILERFNVDRSAKSRALAQLERAGLIKVVRRPRKNPLVTIVEKPTQADQRNEIVIPSGG